MIFARGVRTLPVTRSASRICRNAGAFRLLGSADGAEVLTGKYHIVLIVLARGIRAMPVSRLGILGPSGRWSSVDLRVMVLLERSHHRWVRIRRPHSAGDSCGHSVDPRPP